MLFWIDILTFNTFNTSLVDVGLKIDSRTVHTVHYREDFSEDLTEKRQPLSDVCDVPTKVCIYITVVSLGFVCLFENRFARESRGTDQNLLPIGLSPDVRHSRTVRSGTRGSPNVYLYWITHSPHVPHLRTITYCARKFWFGWGKKFISNERRDSVAEALVNMLSSDEAQTVNIQKAAARVRNARKESIFAFLWFLHQFHIQYDILFSSIMLS